MHTTAGGHALLPPRIFIGRQAAGRVDRWGTGLIDEDLMDSDSLG
jgi:hypothetical protein